MRHIWNGGDSLCERYTGIKAKPRDGVVKDCEGRDLCGVCFSLSKEHARRPSPGQSSWPRFDAPVLKPGGFCEKIENVDKRGFDRTIDPNNGFGWRLLVPIFGNVGGPIRSMRAAGYKVRKGEAGQWLVSFQLADDYA